MRLTNRTVTILKNFAKINPGIVIQPGNWIRTSSPTKTSGAEAKVDDDFPVKFALNDLNDFLSVMTLFKEPDLEFTDDHIHIKENKFEQKYYYSNADSITHKDGPFPNKEYFTSFTLSKNDLQSLIAASSAIGATHIVFNFDNDILEIRASQYQKITGDAKARSNQFKINIDSYDGNRKFSFAVDKNFMTMIPLDYNVSLFASDNGQKLVRFNSEEYSLTYYLSVEKFSTVD